MSGNITVYELAMLAATMDGGLAGHDPEAAITSAIELLCEAELAQKRQHETMAAEAAKRR